MRALIRVLFALVMGLAAFAGGFGTLAAALFWVVATIKAAMDGKVVPPELLWMLAGSSAWLLAAFFLYGPRRSLHGLRQLSSAVVAYLKVGAVLLGGLMVTVLLLDASLSWRWPAVLLGLLGVVSAARAYVVNARWTTQGDALRRLPDVLTRTTYMTVALFVTVYTLYLYHSVIDRTRIGPDDPIPYFPLIVPAVIAIFLIVPRCVTAMQDFFARLIHIWRLVGPVVRDLIVAYVLFVFLFGLLYAQIDVWTHRMAFNMKGVNGQASTLRFSDFFYYSAYTATAQGHPTITPGHPATQFLTFLEIIVVAVVSILYLSVIVERAREEMARLRPGVQMP
jgi:hypothetical protein